MLYLPTSKLHIQLSFCYCYDYVIGFIVYLPQFLWGTNKLFVKITVNLLTNFPSAWRAKPYHKVFTFTHSLEMELQGMLIVGKCMQQKQQEREHDT